MWLLTSRTAFCSSLSTQLAAAAAAAAAASHVFCRRKVLLTAAKQVAKWSLPSLIRPLV
jgi:hypothetical protein